MPVVNYVPRIMTYCSVLQFYGNTVLKAIYANNCPLYKYGIILYYVRIYELFLPDYVFMPYYVTHFLIRMFHLALNFPT